MKQGVGYCFFSSFQIGSLAGNSRLERNCSHKSAYLIDSGRKEASLASFLHIYPNEITKRAEFGDLIGKKI